MTAFTSDRSPVTLTGHLTAVTPDRSPLNGQVNGHLTVHPRRSGDRLTGQCPFTSDRSPRSLTGHLTGQGAFTPGVNAFSERVQGVHLTGHLTVHPRSLNAFTPVSERVHPGVHPPVQGSGERGQDRSPRPVTPTGYPHRHPGPGGH